MADLNADLTIEFFKLFKAMSSVYLDYFAGADDEAKRRKTLELLEKHADEFRKNFTTEWRVQVNANCPPGWCPDNGSCIPC